VFEVWIILLVMTDDRMRVMMMEMSHAAVSIMDGMLTILAMFAVIRWRFVLSRLRLV
jgi:hypothetical protein